MRHARLAALVVALFTMGAAPVPTSHRLEVVFIPAAADGPRAFIVFEQVAQQDGVARTARALVVGAQGSAAIEAADTAPASLRDLTGLVAAPQGASLRWTAEHGVVAGFDHGLAWGAVVGAPADATPPADRRAPRGPAPFPVPTVDGFRLVVDPPWPEGGDRRALPATLYGQGAAVPGTAIVRRGPRGGAVALLVDDAHALEVVEPTAPDLFVVDQIAACGQAAPTAFTVGADDGLLRVESAFTADATPRAACAARGMVVVPVVGERAAARGDQRGGRRGGPQASDGARRFTGVVLLP